MKEQLEMITLPLVIDRSHSGMTDVVFQRLVKRQLMAIRPIIILTLNSNNITQMGIEYLSQRKWQHLNILNLEMNRVGPTGCKLISKTALPELKDLILSRNQIGDLGVMHLAKADLKCLKVLEIQYNYVLGESFTTLNRANWKNIQRVSIWYNEYFLNQIMRFLAYLSAGPRFLVNLDKFSLRNYRRISRIQKMIDPSLLHWIL